jgi:hypothetical protein
VQNRLDHYDSVEVHMRKMFSNVSAYVRSDRAMDEVCSV